MATLTDSYSLANGDTEAQLRASGTVRTYRGQSFEAGVTGTLYSAKFSLAKVGSPTGAYSFRIYAHTGTFGTSSLPGSLLATSDTLNVQDLTTSYQTIELLFTGANRIAITSGTRYVVVIFYNTGGDNSNYLATRDDRSSPSHAGNYVFDAAGTPTANTSIDCPFEVYVETTAIKTVLGLAKASVKTVNGLAIASVKTWNGLA